MTRAPAEEELLSQSSALSFARQSEKEKLASSPYNTLSKSRTGRDAGGIGEQETMSTRKERTGGVLGTTGGTRTRQQKGKGKGAFYVTPELVLSCAKSAGVKWSTEMGGEGGEEKEEDEICLLTVAHTALTEKVQKPWEARGDPVTGKRYLYNCRTGLRAKYHPLEKQLAKVVSTLREQGFHTKNKGKHWLKLADAGGDYWYNFKTNERRESEDGNAPGDAEIIPPCPDSVGLPKFPLQDAGHANVKELVDNVTLLAFKSWWYEDSEEPSLGNGSSAGAGLKKRYVTLEYDLVTKNFRIILEENVAIDVSDVQSKRKMPIECWDLYIGATLDILGKNTTLQQGTFETIQWLDHKAARLLAVKKELLQVLQKYRTASVPAAWSFALNNKPGCCSLRHLMYQIEQLKAELALFRPSLAEAFTIEDVLKDVTGSEAAA